MQPFEIIIIVFAALFVVSVVGISIYRKAKGHNCCSSCGGCTFCRKDCSCRMKKYADMPDGGNDENDKITEERYTDKSVLNEEKKDGEKEGQ